MVGLQKLSFMIKGQATAPNCVPAERHWGACLLTQAGTKVWLHYNLTVAEQKEVFK